MSNLILREWNGKQIRQREDGYISATDMCRAGKKLFGHWQENKSSQEYLEALSTDIGIPITTLIQIFKGGNDKQDQGTWVHRRVAIRLAQWLSPKLAVQVDKWVEEILLKGYVIAKTDDVTLANLQTEIRNLQHQNFIAETKAQSFKDLVFAENIFDNLCQIRKNYKMPFEVLELMVADLKYKDIWINIYQESVCVPSDDEDSHWAMSRKAEWLPKYVRQWWNFYLRTECSESEGGYQKFCKVFELI